MNHLIRSRRGAMVYAAAAPVLAILLMLIPLTDVGNPFVYVDPFTDVSPLRPVMLALAGWMGFALCTWPLLIRRILLRSGGDAGIPGVLLSVLLSLLLWIPAALSAPAGTPEKALFPKAENPQVLAKLPQEDGSLLLISFGACGVVEETPDGWVLREAYKSSREQLSNGDRSAHAYISRSRGDAEDVVVVCKVAFNRDETGHATRPPRDSTGSVFHAVTSHNPVCTEHYYYALVETDVLGYSLWLE